MATNLLRRLAIHLNGGAQSALRETPQQRCATPTAACLPSHGGLANPDFKYMSGSDLRSTMGTTLRKHHDHQQN